VEAKKPKMVIGGDRVPAWLVILKKKKGNGIPTIPGFCLS
jgi:hypothetical protein